VSLEAELFNPLPSPVTTLLIGAPCGSAETSFQLYMGNYTYSTVSAEEPLMLNNFSIPPPCFRAYNSTLTFQPGSDMVYDSSMIANFTHPSDYTSTLSGYWVPDGHQANGATNYAFHQFPAGVYTVLFEDAWGQQQLEYFTVNPK
jgi:hypothetical protein